MKTLFSKLLTIFISLNLVLTSFYPFLIAAQPVYAQEPGTYWYCNGDMIVEYTPEGGYRDHTDCAGQGERCEEFYNSDFGANDAKCSPVASSSGFGEGESACVADCSDAQYMCQGQSFGDQCGGTCWGTKDCSTPEPAETSAPEVQSSPEPDWSSYWGYYSSVVPTAETQDPGVTQEIQSTIDSGADGPGGCCDNNYDCNSGEECTTGNGACTSSFSCTLVSSGVWEEPQPSVCVADCSDAQYMCQGQSFGDQCGGTCWGEKDCSIGEDISPRVDRSGQRWIEQEIKEAEEREAREAKKRGCEEYGDCPGSIHTGTVYGDWVTQNQQDYANGRELYGGGTAGLSQVIVGVGDQTSGFVYDSFLGVYEAIDTTSSGIYSTISDYQANQDSLKFDKKIWEAELIAQQQDKNYQEALNKSLTDSDRAKSIKNGFDLPQDTPDDKVLDVLNKKLAGQGLKAEGSLRDYKLVVVNPCLQDPNSDDCKTIPSISYGLGPATTTGPAIANTGTITSTVSYAGSTGEGLNIGINLDFLKTPEQRKRDAAIAKERENCIKNPDGNCAQTIGAASTLQEQLDAYFPTSTDEYLLAGKLIENNSKDYYKADFQAELVRVMGPEKAARVRGEMIKRAPMMDAARTGLNFWDATPKIEVPSAEGIAAKENNAFNAALQQAVAQRGLEKYQEANELPPEIQVYVNGMDLIVPVSEIAKLINPEGKDEQEKMKNRNDAINGLILAGVIQFATGGTGRTVERVGAKALTAGERIAGKTGAGVLEKAAGKDVVKGGEKAALETGEPVLAGTKGMSVTCSECKIIDSLGGSKTLASAGHPNINEDALLCNPATGICAVFDGMGGVAGGAEASRITSEAFNRALQVLPKNASREEVIAAMRSAEASAKNDMAMVARTNRDLREMGTTATVVKVVDEGASGKAIIVGQAGDSRAYFVNKKTGQIEQLSVDQNIIPDDLKGKFDQVTKESQLSAGELAVFRTRNLVDNSLGPNGGNLKIRTLSTSPDAEGYIMTVSDGVTDNLTTSQIEAIARNNKSNPQKLADELVKESRKIADKKKIVDGKVVKKGDLRSKPDDITASVVDISGQSKAAASRLDPRSGQWQPPYTTPGNQVKIQRSSGAIEGGWFIKRYDSNTDIVEVVSRDERWSKQVTRAELESWNSVVPRVPANVPSMPTPRSLQEFSNAIRQTGRSYTDSNGFTVGADAIAGRIEDIERRRANPNQVEFLIKQLPAELQNQVRTILQQGGRRGFINQEMSYLSMLGNILKLVIGSTVFAQEEIDVKEVNLSPLSESTESAKLSQEFSTPVEGIVTQERFKITKALTSLKHTLADNSQVTSQEIKQALEENAEIQPEGLKTDDKVIVTTGSSGQVQFEADQGTYQLEVLPVKGVNIIIPTVVTLDQDQEIIAIGLNEGEEGVKKIDQKENNKKVNAKKASKVKIMTFYDKNSDGKLDNDEKVVPWAGVAVTLIKAAQDQSIDLRAGWNLVTLTAVPEKPLTASTLLGQIVSQGGYAMAVSTLINGAWKSYVVRGDKDYSNPTDDFAIEPGKAYFVKALKKSSFNFTGQNFAEPVKVKLSSGWNAVGLPKTSKDYKASDLPGDIAARWDFGLWDTFVKKNEEKYGNDFSILNTEGYILKVEKEGDLSP